MGLCISGISYHVGAGVLFWARAKSYWEHRVYNDLIDLWLHTDQGLSDTLNSWGAHREIRFCQVLTTSARNYAWAAT